MQQVNRSMVNKSIKKYKISGFDLSFLTSCLFDFADLYSTVHVCDARNGDQCFKVGLITFLKENFSVLNNGLKACGIYHLQRYKYACY